MSAAIQLTVARTEADYAQGRELFEEYAQRLGIDLGFQNLAFELEHVPDVYGPPAGCLLLGRREIVVGCVGVRALADGICEMKRLYVRQAARGTGLGRRLAEAAVAWGRARGYHRMVLDTLASMTVARGLYTSLGFRATAPYYANPLPDIVYLALDLRPAAP